MDQAGYMRLCRRPYIWKERGMIRWPGAIELNWRSYFGFGLKLVNEGDRGEDRWPWMISLHFAWLSLFLHIPGPRRQLFDKYGEPAHGEWEQWGFYTFDGALVLCWGMRSKHIDFPWTYTFIYKEDLSARGEWVREPKNVWRLSAERYTVDKLTRTLPYTYKLKSGELQHRLATVTEGRWIRRRHFLKWTSWLQWVDHCIQVEFDDEVGERAGSWKGGCIGCGYPIKRGETATQCLRRMERERVFR